MQNGAVPSLTWSYKPTHTASKSALRCSDQWPYYEKMSTWRFQSRFNSERCQNLLRSTAVSGLLWRRRASERMGQDLIQRGAVRPPSFALWDVIPKSQSALVAGISPQRGARGRAGCAGGCWGDPCFTRPPRRDLWALICCCQPPLICEQAGMSLGERVGAGQRGAAKEGFTAAPALRGWAWICSITAWPGHPGGRKTANNTGAFLFRKWAWK